jgi:hypothetical protein
MLDDHTSLIELLGKKLKDNDVLEILEDYQIEDVVYDFDRLHENAEDIYWASAKSAGFQLRFNQDQVLNTIFCHVVADEGFAPISPDIMGAPIYKTFDEAEVACKNKGLRYSTSDPTKGPQHYKWWLRIESADYSSHYQFQDGSIFLITLSVPKA